MISICILILLLLFFFIIIISHSIHFFVEKKSWSCMKKHLIVLKKHCVRRTGMCGTKVNKKTRIQKKFFFVSLYYLLFGRRTLSAFSNFFFKFCALANACQRIAIVLFFCFSSNRFLHAICMQIEEVVYLFSIGSYLCAGQLLMGRSVETISIC